MEKEKSTSLGSMANLLVEVIQETTQFNFYFIFFLKPKKRKYVTDSTFLSSVCHEVMGLDAMISFIYLFNFNWRLIILQYCGGFCHTFTWISHGCTCVPHPESLSYLTPHPISQGHPSAPALSTLPHASNLDWRSISHIHVSMLFSQVIPPSPSSKESKSLFFFNLCVSFAFLHIGSSLPSF